jgi:hypothetical protein
MAVEGLAGYPYAAPSRNPFNYVKFEQILRDVVTPWLSLSLITNHLNLFDDTSQDTYISSLELATRFAIEDYLGLSIFPVTYRVWYGPEGLVASPTSLDLPEVSQNFNSLQAGLTINKVAYYNSSNVLTVIAPSIYYYDASGNKVIVSSLPTDINSAMTAPIIVEYTTVANPLQTYPSIQQAALLLLTHLYNNRSNTTNIMQKDIPFGVSTLLRPYKPLVM